ncbi:hypothetical protein O1611_g6190 [Lasiodiplodia mahajangana]|uniref:Uncharacterized protein n=1 Tax=Lasiodiplodia mahajangana TaxID=1108764 RepID=A0ACC2JIV1_9PEZI|nr:hypothetical protein O1611_g6190 [Lasiodiplodia mahajangana]
MRMLLYLPTLLTLYLAEIQIYRPEGVDAEVPTVSVLSITYHDTWSRDQTQIICIRIDEASLLLAGFPAFPNTVHNITSTCGFANMATHITYDRMKSAYRYTPFIVRYKQYIWPPIHLGAILGHIFLWAFGLKECFVRINAGDLADSLDILGAIVIGVYGTTLYIFWSLFVFVVGGRGEGLSGAVMIGLVWLSIVLDVAVVCNSSLSGPLDICIAASVAAAFGAIAPILNDIMYLRAEAENTAEEEGLALYQLDSVGRERYADTAENIDG